MIVDDICGVCICGVSTHLYVNAYIHTPQYREMIVDDTRGAREYLHVLPTSRKSAIALYVEKGVRAARKRKYFKRTQKRRTHTP